MKLRYLFLFLLIFLGFYLRRDNLNTWPRLGATFDEYAWTWIGINLIQNRVPVSWSPHPQYKDAKRVIYQNTDFNIVKPYLEHPPLFGLVVGSYAILNGVENMYDLHIRDIRGLALLLGVASIFILYLFLAQLYGHRLALLGSLLYATIPTITVGSRLVQNENFFIPFWLLSLFLITRFIKTRNPWLRNIVALICGLLVLAKIPWVAGGLSIFLILLFYRRHKDIYKFLLIFIPLVIIYFAYGIYFDKELFLDIFRFQLNRYDLTFNSIFALFQNPLLADRFYIDGWIYFGWFAFILLLIKNPKQHLIITAALISYFLIFLSAIPNEAGHGWYRFPFYPFLTASIAIFLKDYFVKNWMLTFIFLVFIGTSLFQLTWANLFGFSYPILRLSIIGWTISLLPFFIHNKKIEKLAKLSSYMWFGIFILMNIWAVMVYNEM